ncbi:MAG: ABC transporter permease [Acidobacteriota bacterium]
MRVQLKTHRLVQELAKKPISLNRWAQRLGLSSGHLSDLVNGRRRYPAPKTRRKLMDGLDLPFEALFDVLEPAARKPRPAEPKRFVDASQDRPLASQRPLRGSDEMHTLFRDFRYAARGLMRSPAFTLAAVLTLAIGIASNSALFSLVDSILWRPFPYHDGERLISVLSANSNRGRGWGGLSFPDSRDFVEQTTRVSGLAAWDWEPYGLSDGEQPLRVGGTRVSAGFFEVLGIEPLAGRTIQARDDTPEAPPVMVLSEGLWRSYFGGEDVVGTSVLINARPTTIIGIMPGGTEYPDLTRLWVPLALNEEAAPRGSNFLGVIGRLGPGVELEELNAEIETLGQRLVEDHPQANRDRVYRAVALRELLVEDVESITLSMLGVVTFVLLIVCANVANLLLARGAAREREVAIRRALGASSRRLAQLLLCEAFLLALAGGIIGFVFGWLGMTQLAGAVSNEIPPWVQTSMSWRVVAYTVGISLLTGLIFSLLPILHSFRLKLSGALRETGSRQGTSVRGGRLRSSLVVSEIALSLVLLAGAGLMVKSLLDLTSVDPGFETRGSLTVGLDLLSLIEAEPEERVAQFGLFLERFANVPGVEAVGAINFFPLKGRSSSIGVTLEGQNFDQASQNTTPQVSLMTPGYFKAMGIPVLQGSEFERLQPTEGDGQAIISQGLAAALWPGEEAIGQRLRLGLNPTDEPSWLTVAGIVGDIHHHGLDRERQTHLYLNYADYAPARMVVIVRHTGDTAAMALSIREAAATVDPNQPLHEIMSTGAVIESSIWQWRFFTSIAWLFGVVAVLLAAIGIYGVMTYTVSQRTAEVGIRMALGANRGQVVSLILRQGSRLVLLGLAIGLPVSIALSQVLSSFLFSVGAFEPAALGAAILLLMLVALPALLLPARRAATVDPSSSLRAD